MINTWLIGVQYVVGLSLGRLSSNPFLDLDLARIFLRLGSESFTSVFC